MAQPLSDSLRGEVRVVDDVPAAYAGLLAEAFRAAAPGPFVLACSGGASGAAVLRAAVASGEIDWSRVELVLVDERCVAPESPDSNERSLQEALGAALVELAGFHPMRCADGAGAYEELLRRFGRIDVVQLGFGPDGHTASLFPGSAGLRAGADRLVTENVDPLGNNRFERLTLTLAGIALGRLVVIAVMGAEKSAALAALAGGEDFPAGRVAAARLVWLIDRDAAGGAGG